MKFTIEDWLGLSKKLIIWGSAGILVAYLLFILSGFILTPVINSRLPELEQALNKSTGLEFKAKNLQILTYPDLSVGVKIYNLNISQPISNADEKFSKNSKTVQNKVYLKDLATTLKLTPLLFRQIQLGQISTSSIVCDFIIKEDGNLSVMDIFEQTESTENAINLPLGFRLSNHLPGVYAKNYEINFHNIAQKRKSTIVGENFKLTDFVLDKRIKVSTVGKILFNDKKIITYNINVFNKIMPNVQLHDLIFQKDIVADGNMPAKMPELAANNSIVGQKDGQTSDNLAKIKNLDFNKIFTAIDKNNFNAEISTKMNISGDLKNLKLNGFFNADKFSIAFGGKQLPDSNIGLKFRNNLLEISSNIYTSLNKSEKTTFNGTIKKNFLDINVKSKADLGNITKLVNGVFKTIGVNDFETLSASGKIDADFSVNTNMKTLNTKGFFNLNDGNLVYSLYNIAIGKIHSSIDFANNNINIKDLSLEILNHPLEINGIIKQNSDTDINITMDKMPIKGLMFALGKLSIIKENDINSGLLSFRANIKGTLKDLKPKVYTVVENVNIYNKPLKSQILLSKMFTDLTLQNKNFAGTMALNSLIFKQNKNVISVPATNLTFNNKDALIKNSSILINNSKINITGQVKNYLKENLNINISAGGNLAANDLAMFIPQNSRKFFPHRGYLPLSAKISGNKKTQAITLNISANPNNYLTIMDIKALRNKQTQIKANAKITDGHAKFTNSGVFTGSNNLIKLTGDITNIYSNPKLNLAIAIPNRISFPIWGFKNSNITGNGKINITGEIFNPNYKGTLNFSDISVKDLDFVLTNSVASLNGKFLNGDIKVGNFKFGFLNADSLASTFTLKNFNNVYFDNITGRAYSGKINGKMSYDIAKTVLGMELTGAGLNATDAVYSVVALKNALTGALDFHTKFTTHGFDYKDIVYYLTGNADFVITNGRFMGIGKVENIVNAQNIAGNYLLKSALNGLSTFSTIQKTDKFDKITGDVILGKGNAQIKNIKVFGPLMSYYVTGTYFIITNSANLKILGRLDSSVVSCLGVIGSFSADKLLGAIPKIGDKTLQILNQLTEKPETENIALIPALTSGSKYYKDFKATFYGSVQKVNSLRTFKWLSKCDTSKIDLKKEVQAAATNVKNDVVQTVENTKNNIFVIKNNITNILQAQKQRIQSIQSQVKKEEPKQTSSTAADTKPSGENKTAAPSSSSQKTEAQTTTTTKPVHTNTQTTSTPSASNGGNTSSGATTTTSSTPTTAPANTSSTETKPQATSAATETKTETQAPEPKTETPAQTSAQE